MLSLLLHVVFLCSFELIVKRGTLRKMDMTTIGTLNFVVAALVGIPLWAASADAEVSGATLGLGTVMGFCYLTSFFFVLYSIRHQGVAATRALMQLALIIPIVFSVFWWNERPHGAQTLGLIIAVGSIVLLDARRDLEQRTRTSLRWTMVAMFLLIGGARLTAKAFTEMGTPEQTAFFFIALFAFSGIGATVKILWQRPAMPPSAWAYGSLLGLINITQALFLIRAVAELPGIIVFPAAACASVAVTTLFATLLLGERPTSRQYVGIAASSAAVVLLGMTNAMGG